MAEMEWAPEHDGVEEIALSAFMWEKKLNAISSCQKNEE
jgi:hypothetical protein